MKNHTKMDGKKAYIILFTFKKEKIVQILFGKIYPQIYADERRFLESENMTKTEQQKARRIAIKHMDKWLNEPKTQQLLKDIKKGK